MKTTRKYNDLLRCIKEQGYVITSFEGSSMWPLLVEGKSKVCLFSYDDQILQKNDIILYQRMDGSLILHRIIGKISKEEFITCGDHQWKEQEHVMRSQILAVMDGYYKNGKYHKKETKIYDLLWNRSLLLRRICLAVLRISGLERSH